MAILAAGGLIFVVLDYLLARMGVEKPARSGIWASAPFGLYMDMFLPHGLNGLARDLIMFSVLILAFALAYLMDRWGIGLRLFQRGAR